MQLNTFGEAFERLTLFYLTGISFDTRSDIGHHAFAIWPLRVVHDQLDVSIVATYSAQRNDKQSVMVLSDFHNNGHTNISMCYRRKLYVQW